MNFERIIPIWLDETDSTNSEAMRLLKAGNPLEGTCICAHYQREGKGQRTNRWLSSRGMNLLTSFILYPPANADQQPFLLSKTIALAVQQTVMSFTSRQAEIKWPNDILLDGKKVAGILIENQWSGSTWHAAVVGIGINVNQREFDAIQATSLSEDSSGSIDLTRVLGELQKNLSSSYERLHKRDFSGISKDYHTHLFGKTEYHNYRDAQLQFRAKVTQVLSDGRIELITDQEKSRAYDLSEVKLLY
jgi:BirA family biotin operon repressor/biotin-[acetyl-CoA-carboxylase] ligase